jgi:hypothetical protein
MQVSESTGVTLLPPVLAPVICCMIKEANMRLETAYEGKRIVIDDKSDSRNVDMLNQVTMEKGIELEFKPV